MERVTSRSLAVKFGMEWSISDLVITKSEQEDAVAGAPGLHGWREAAEENVVWGACEEKTLPWAKEEMFPLIFRRFS